MRAVLAFAGRFGFCASSGLTRRAWLMILSKSLRSSAIRPLAAQAVWLSSIHILSVVDVQDHNDDGADEIQDSILPLSHAVNGILPISSLISFFDPGGVGFAARASIRRFICPRILAGTFVSRYLSASSLYANP